MGQKLPKEANMGNSLRCARCNDVLPPCRSFSDLYKRTIDHKRVYVFNGGAYFRQMGHSQYFCNDCFYRKIWEREQKKRREEQQKRKERLSERLQQSQQKAEQQQQQQQLSRKSVELERKQSVLKQQLDEFSDDENSIFSDDLLNVLSVQCDTPITSLSAIDLSDDHVREIMSALDTLLFEKWIDIRPPLSTLQHAQVFLTQLCTMSLDTSDETVGLTTSKQMQSLVQNVSQTAGNVFENFLLAQALYLTLVELITDNNDTVAMNVAKCWAEDELSTDTIFVINFLCTLTESLKNVVGMASIFVLNMELQCLSQLFDILTHLTKTEAHKQITEMLLSLVNSNGWNPSEALSLLKLLSERYSEDASIIKILTLLQIYDVSPTWKDNCERSLIEAMDFLGPDEFYKTFQETLENQELDNSEALAELGKRWNLDESLMKRVLDITNQTSDVLRKLPKDPEGGHALKRDHKLDSLSDDNIKEILTDLSKAVFHTKGWWPSRTQMNHWCAVVLSEKSQPPQMVGFQEDPCVTAMIAAFQISLGNKLDVVLSSGALSVQETREWADFYKHLGISLNTNRRTADEPQSDIYEADIVYGGIEDFLTDHFEYSMEVMEARQPQRIRGFIVENGCLSPGQNPRFSRLRKKKPLKVVALELQSLMRKFSNEEVELRYSFLRAIYNVLQDDLKDNVNKNVMNLSQVLTGKELPPHDVFVLTFLECLTKAVAKEIKATRKTHYHVIKWCFESLLSCAMRFQASKTAKELLEKVFNLVTHRLWSPKETLALLGALTAHHKDENFVSITTILNLMSTYQLSSYWKDEKDQSLLQLLGSLGSKDLISHVDNTCKKEGEKSLDKLFNEIRVLGDLDEETIEKSYTIVKHVQDLIKSGEIKNHADVGTARRLCKSMKTEDLQEVLAVLCNGIHITISRRRWWPRGTQMASWCFLTLANNGKLLQMGTGEGKSVVVAMFAALHALRGQKVDVISSSPVLCQRDAEECADFFSYFGLTVDANTTKTKDSDRKKCYEKDVIYGTVETYAADHLRQTFEMKDVRPDRKYECVIIDEVDLLLLDQGIQVTYLSSPMVSMQHLNIILTMIWAHVSQYKILSAGHQTLICGPTASFYKAIFDSMDTDSLSDTEEKINDATDVLQIAEDCNIVPDGFTEGILKSDKDEILNKLKTVSLDAQLKFYKEMEQYVPYGFTAYVLDDNGSLALKTQGSTRQVVHNLKFLALENGMCCPIYDSEDVLTGPIAHLIRSQLLYTPCKNDKTKVNVPGFLKDLVESKAAVWVQNAFLAMRLKKGHEYVVEEGCIYPVDFKSTGTIELNKKWGEGLQQFVEIKHQIKISTMTAVTNYVSNVSFFEKYNGKIYGLTGTLGSKADMMFLNNQYPNLSSCEMPSFKGKKLFEVSGVFTKTTKDWRAELKRVLMEELTANSNRGARAALIICETINRVGELYDELKDAIPGEIIQYSRGDPDSQQRIKKKLQPGDVILATNLAGRGTNIKVTDEVNDSGGLFVILSFLADNERVERQAFGRTARKGHPGSAQVVMCTAHLHECYTTLYSIAEAKSLRDSLAIEKIQDMQDDIEEMKLREDLFSLYCKTLQTIYNSTEKDEQKAIVAIMNEFWGIWLQTHSKEVDALKRQELIKSLTNDLATAKKQTESQNSPSASIYHYVKFGNIEMKEKNYNAGAKLFEKATKVDESWAAIAFYNESYCIIKQQSGGYLDHAIKDLKKAQESLKYFSEECLTGLSFVKMSLPSSAKGKPNSLEKQYSTKCNMLSYLDKNMAEAVKKLGEIKGRGRDALAKRAPVFTLVSDTEEELQMETFVLYDRGLKYIFTVEEEPRFPWEALVVFFLGLLQVVAGALLTAFTFGTLAQVGMGLIAEGISDCITGIESMITGEFSWESWAIDKAISIGVSLIGFGIGKLVSKGFKVAKSLAKGLSKLKTLPKFFASQAKQGFSTAMKTNMKNALKLTAKKIVEETAAYGIERAENEIINLILAEIEKAVIKGIYREVKTNMEKDPLLGLTNFIILSHVQTRQEFNDLMKDKIMTDQLESIFTGLSTTALEPYSADLGWQNQLSASIINVIEGVKEDAKGKTKAILIAIQTVHMSALAADAVASVVTLSAKYFKGLADGLAEFKKKKNLRLSVNASDLSGAENKLLTDFRKKIESTIASLLGKALVAVFHQKFSSHLVSLAQSKANDAIGSYISSSLNTEATEKLMQTAQENTQSKYDESVNPGKQSKDHAAKVQNSENKGGPADMQIMAEATNTRILVITETKKKGKYKTMEQMSPKTQEPGQTVVLIYRPKSEKHPDGHYDVLIKGKPQSVKDGDFYSAMAFSMNPKAKDKELDDAVTDLRTKEAEALEGDPSFWEIFLSRDEWISEAIMGSWNIQQGASTAHVTMKEKIKNIMKEQSVGSVYNTEWLASEKDIQIVGVIVNGVPQPPRNSFLMAENFLSDSKLIKAMSEVASHLSKEAKLPVVYAPYERYNKFPTAQSPKLKKSLALAMSKDDVEGAFKLVVLCGMPTFMLGKCLDNDGLSLTRLEAFQARFPIHAVKMVAIWFKLLEKKTDIIKSDMLQKLENWINTKRYLDPNDPHTKEVLSYI